MLGELLESRYMLPLLLPSDPRLLAAVPKKTITGLNTDDHGRTTGETRTSSSAFEWSSRCKQVRKLNLDILSWIDGARDARRWLRQNSVHSDRIFDEEGGDGFANLVPSPEHSSVDSDEFNAEPVMKVVHLTHMNRVPSRSRTTRSSTG